MNDGKRTMSNTFHPVDVNHPLLPEKAREFQMFINGKWTTGHSSESFVRKSPAHDIVVSTYPAGTVEDVDEAVKAARDAFDCGKWSRISGAARAAVLLKTAQLIRENLAELALLETLETGKPIAQSRGEIQGAADIWEYAAGLARSINGDSFNNLGDNMLGLVTREPIGVVGVITPWNFPFFIGAERYPYILAAGCTLVAKAAEITSGTTLLLAGILKEAGLPDGVFNVVTGSGSVVGQRITEHVDIDMVSFTGSTAVGQMALHASAKNIKRLVWSWAVKIRRWFLPMPILTPRWTVRCLASCSIPGSAASAAVVYWLNVLSIKISARSWLNARRKCAAAIR